MQRKIITTKDGSKTIQLVDWDEQYHSKHGALQEALHVFIKMGLDFTLSRKRNNSSSIHVLEYGLGTGLNAVLTELHCPIPVHYTGVEAFPISSEEAVAVDYGTLLKAPEIYRKLHDLEWESPHILNESFTLTKRQMTFDQIAFKEQFDLIYYDCFGPRVQPELWTSEVFEKAYSSLKEGGVLTTYCAQGQARRNMQQVGFKVERLPGPPGKREMLRAIKE